MSDVKQKTGSKPSKKVLDKKKKRQNGAGDDPTKEEYAVAKFVRFKCPTKKTNFGPTGGDEVHYFVGSKAVDSLMQSKWSSKNAKKNPPLFTDRQSCVNYMQELLMKGLFFRARKLVPKIKEKEPAAGEKKKKAGEPTKEGGSPKASKDSELKQRKKSKKEDDADDEKEKDDKENGNEKAKEKSKNRKIKLDFHSEQLFIDGPSIYVWKYDPTPLKTFLLGLAIVFGAIGLCLFPLWPLQIRAGVYYLSLAAMGFFGLFIGLVVLRAVIFGAGWLFSMGRHHFWLFPHLTDDCGVLESFQPLYSYKYMTPGTKSQEEKSSKKKDKKSDTEDEGNKNDGDEIGDESGNENENENGENENGDFDPDKGEDEISSGSQDEDQSMTENSEHDDEENQNESAQNSTMDDDDSQPQTSAKIDEKKGKKRKGVRRDDRTDSNNGDFEFIEKPSSKSSAD